jgi:hypothetical protein
MAPPISHPLYFQFHWLSQSALRVLREMRDHTFNTTFLDDYRDMPANTRGSLVGAAFQRKLTKWLEHVQPGAWRKGEGAEPDIVCTYNSDFSFEMKTSSSKNRSIVGNRVQATANKPPCFLLYVNYWGDTLTVREVRLGWVGPNDWQPQHSDKGQAAHIKPEAREQFVTLPIHGELSLLSYACDPNVDWHN